MYIYAQGFKKNMISIIDLGTIPLSAKYRLHHSLRSITNRLKQINNTSKRLSYELPPWIYISTPNAYAMIPRPRFFVMIFPSVFNMIL